MEPYELILTRITPEVSFGYSTIHVYRPDELESGQLGYSVNPEGESLVGDQDGGWRSTWLVIGYDEICGDPLFIDISVEGYPVYTAMHGAGRWDPDPVAISLTGFAHAISALAAIAKGREYPVALEQNPLTPSERNLTLAVIRQANPGIALGFWETLLSE